MIRGKTRQCPFGLPISGGCKSAGAAVVQMTELSSENSDEERRDIMEENWNQLLLLGDSKACPFADLIMESGDSVDCKFDRAHGARPAGNVGLQGSPLYPHTYVGNSPEAQYGYPMEYYSDNNNRSVYYGLMQLI